MVLEASRQLAPVLMEPISLLGILKIVSCLWSLLSIMIDNGLVYHDIQISNEKCVNANGRVYIHKKGVFDASML